MVGSNTGSEQLSRTAVGAGADPATRLGVLASVRVEVSVSNTVEDTEDLAISVDSFYILPGVRAQSVSI